MNDNNNEFWKKNGLATPKLVPHDRPIMYGIINVFPTCMYSEEISRMSISIYIFTRISRLYCLPQPCSYLKMNNDGNNHGPNSLLLSK